MALDRRPTRVWLRSSTSEQGPSVDLRLMLPALAAWVGAAVGLAGGKWAGLVIGVGLVTAVIAANRRRWTLCGIAAAMLVAGLVAWLWVSVLAASTPGRWAGQGGFVEVRATVASDVRHWPARNNRPEAAVLPLTLKQVESHGEQWRGSLPAEIRATGDAVAGLDQPVGATIAFHAVFRSPQPGDRSVGTLSLRSDVALVREPGRFAALANRLRDGLRGAMILSPPPQAGLVPSLVVGDVSRLAPEVKDAFVATGLTHLTAVSGTNLTLMLAFCLGLARRLGVRGWWLRVVGLAVAVAFVVVCRAEPSVLRAAAMGLIAMAATGLARDRCRGLRTLSLAVLLLVLVDPWLSRSWGFALSVTASAGILWWGGRWQASMRGWAPGWLAESLAIPLAAQLATQPIVTALSGEISVVGLAANVAVGPFVGPVTILGLAAALASLFSMPLACLLGWLAGWCVQPILLVASIGADAPAATWRWPGTPPALALLVVGCLVAAQIVVPGVLPRRWAMLLMAALLVTGAIRQPPQPGWPGNWAVVACDVGQGGAQLVRVGPQSAILVDAGPEPGALRRCLDSVNVTELPLLVITHPHADHVGGLAAVVGRLRVGMVLVGPSPPGVAVDPSAWLAGLPAPTTTKVGDIVRVGDVSWTTLAAGPVPGMLASTGPENSNENDTGVVGLIDTGRLRVLVTGDLEVAGQQALVASGAGLRADVLVVPHHGSPKQDPSFIEAVAAPIALIQVGERNDYGHPASATLRLLGQRGATIFRTDRQGAIAVTADRRHVVTQR